MSEEELIGSWIEPYLREGDITNFFNNIDWESKEPEEVIEYLFSIYKQLQQENKQLKEKDYDHFAYLKRIDNLEQENERLKDYVEYWQEACDKRQDKIFELLEILEGDK